MITSSHMQIGKYILSKKKVAIFNYDNARGGAADSYRRILMDLSHTQHVILDLIAFPSASVDKRQNLFIRRPKIIRLLDKFLFSIGLGSYILPNIPRISILNKLREQDVIILFNLHGGSMSIWDILWFKLACGGTIVLRTSDIYWVTGRCALPSWCDEYLIECSNCRYLEEYPAGKRKFLSFDLKIKKMLVNSVVDIIATPSNWIEKIFKRQYPSKKYIHVRNSYTPVNDLQILKQAVPKKSLEKLTFLFCASDLRDDRKGFNLLAEFLTYDSEVADKFNFIILGEYDSAFKKNYLLLFKKKNVRFTGHCQKKDLEEWYSRSDVYVHLSYSDNFPNTILLAHTLALPIICIDVGGVAELMSMFNAGSKIALDDQTVMRSQLAAKTLEISENYIAYKNRANGLSASLATYCTELDVLTKLIEEA